MAKRPGAAEVYVAVSAGPERRPAIVVAAPGGAARALDLAGLPATVAKLDNPPSGDARFWGRLPLRSFTVTAMQWHDGKLYVAGLANGAFAWTLRILGTPFSGSQAVTSVAMYHTTHNQIETRAPIRAMSFQTLNGRDTLVAAYLCSPIVTIPLDALKDGTHVEGKTIAELGYGDVANSMVTFQYGPPGKAAPAILLVNDQRDADVLPVSGPVSFGIHCLTHAVGAFLDRHPGISVELELDDRVVDVVQERFDLAVRIGRLADSSLIARRVAPIRHAVCASPDYLRRHGVPLTPRDLAALHDGGSLAAEHQQRRRPARGGDLRPGHHPPADLHLPPCRAGR